MADLLYKIFIIIPIALIISSLSANAFESSFPFPFEFGHSSDIYLDVKKPETKKTRQVKQAALDLLREKGIKTDDFSIIEYIKKNEIGTIKLLLDAGFDPNKTINASYPLYYAARYNRKQIMYTLLEAGADPNRDFTSPLRFAVLRKDYDCTKLLVDYGANVNYYDMSSDEYLLYTALKKKEYDIATLLLSKGAKVDNKSYVLIKKKNLEKKLGIMLN